MAVQKKPNIVAIMADDVGMWNLSCYHRGMMGGSTPNIDRIAGDGALFTDYYAQNSCTAGRAAFITGQTPFRTGLLKVGLPAAKQGLQDGDPTLAELLKPHGYVSAQIGKNHLGDRNEFLPTVHGFDEFYGILYHLNAMEEPYDGDYPKVPGFHDRFGPRNIIESHASTSTTRPRTRTGVGSASRPSSTPVRCPRTLGWTRTPRSAWKTSSSSWSGGPVTSWNVPSPLTRRSSCGATRRAATSGRTCQRSGRTRAATTCTPTRRWSSTGRSVSSSTSSTSSASPTTRSCCSPATTAPRSSPGP